LIRRLAAQKRVQGELVGHNQATTAGCKLPRDRSGWCGYTVSRRPRRCIWATGEDDHRVLY
jgi:hypothetical protein